MKTTIVDLLRHGEVQGGACYRGSSDDPLTDLGWRQMQKQTAECEWDAVISSPLSRCHQFANQLSHHQQIILQTEPDLREICFGDWEGKTADQIAAQSPHALEDFHNNPVNHTPPNGEPFVDFRQRVKSAWDKCTSSHQDQHILIITHAGVIRVLFTMLLGIPYKQSFQIKIPHACLSRFTCFHTDDSNFIQLNFHKPL